MEMIFATGKAGASALDERRTDVEAERIDAKPALRPPRHEAFEQVPIGASDVDEGAWPVHRVEDRLALGAPSHLAATEAGLTNRIGMGEIGGGGGVEAGDEVVRQLPHHRCHRTRRT